MKRAVLIALVVLLTSCAGGRGTAPVSVPGHGVIAITVIPNPIVATHVSGNMYSLPFEVMVRETGGRPVDISSITAHVYALGGFRVGTETYDAAQIRSLGFPTRVPANSELRYRFTPQREVPDERLFSGVSAELKVEGQDDTGTPTSAGTSVSVRR